MTTTKTREALLVKLFLHAYGLLLMFIAAGSLMVHAAVGDPVVPPDWHVVALNAVNALTPVLTVAIVWGVKLAVAHIPRWILPFLALAASNGVVFVGTLVAGGTYDPLTASLLGAAAVYLREVVTTFAEHGIGSTGANQKL